MDPRPLYGTRREDEKFIEMTKVVDAVYIVSDGQEKITSDDAPTALQHPRSFPVRTPGVWILFRRQRQGDRELRM